MIFRNVFVLCTGRCGSVTFAKAASHIFNATAGHETRSHFLGADRLAYGPNHIEVDNRLAWILGRLDQTYGRNAFYVHLIRNPEAVAASFAARHNHGIMQAYSNDILMSGIKKNSNAAPLDFAHDYITTVTANITQFLRDKPHKMTFRMEQATYDLSWFWKAIEAKGDLEAARAEWQIKHNART